MVEKLRTQNAKSRSQEEEQQARTEIDGHHGDGWVVCRSNFWVKIEFGLVAARSLVRSDCAVNQRYQNQIRRSNSELCKYKVCWTSSESAAENRISVKMSSAALKSLVRKLLVKVHPDVIAAKSERARSHNEKALKALLGCLDSDSTRLSQAERQQKIFFYLREGGQTSTVKLDFEQPETTVRELLGLSTETTTAAMRGDIHDGFGQKRSRAESDSTRKDVKVDRKEFSRIFNESLERWWNARDVVMSNVDLLFHQDRIRFAPNALDVTSKVPVDEYILEMNRAVDLMRQTLEFFVDETTPIALQHPKLRDISIVVIGDNLEETEIKNRMLFVPLDASPEIVGEELDFFVDQAVEAAIADESDIESSRTQ